MRVRKRAGCSLGSLAVLCESQPQGSCHMSTSSHGCCVARKGCSHGQCICVPGCSPARHPCPITLSECATGSMLRQLGKPGVLQQQALCRCIQCKLQSWGHVHLSAFVSLLFHCSCGKACCRSSGCCKRSAAAGQPVPRPPPPAVASAALSSQCQPHCYCCSRASCSMPCTACGHSHGCLCAMQRWCGPGSCSVGSLSQSHQPPYRCVLSVACHQASHAAGATALCCGVAQLAPACRAAYMLACIAHMDIRVGAVMHSDTSTWDSFHVLAFRALCICRGASAPLVARRVQLLC